LKLSFRIEKLLLLRKSQVYLAHKSVSSIDAEIISHQASFELIKETENKNKIGFDQRLQGNMDVKTRRLFDKYFDCQKGKRVIKLKALEQLTDQRENKYTELISAIKKTKSLEILQQRKFQNAKRAAMIIKNNSYEEHSTLWQGRLS
jgi:flagellar biosynthesis chaperone FliJ